MLTCWCISLRVYVCMHLCLHSCMCVCMYVCMHVFVCVCVFVCGCVCVYIYVSNQETTPSGRERVASSQDYCVSRVTR